MFALCHNRLDRNTQRRLCIFAIFLSISCIPFVFTFVFVVRFLNVFLCIRVCVWVCLPVYCWYDGVIFDSNHWNTNFIDRKNLARFYQFVLKERKKTTFFVMLFFYLFPSNFLLKCACVGRHVRIKIRQISIFSIWVQMMWVWFVKW